MGTGLNRFTLTLAVVGTLLLSTSCGNNEIQELKALIEWNPEYTKNWAPAIGSSLPPLSVKDTSGNTPSIDDLTGERGLLIFFVRSTNW
ncbi:MAG: hypothetical protein OXG25_14400 [Gammaproteobacteria bacterium]|nr:hypothetical protein [Gammaproteobacteria bacterium]